MRHEHSVITMDHSDDASSTSSSHPQDEDGSLEAYNTELLRQAKGQCELMIRRANIKKLTEDINALAKEVKRECLVEKWGNSPMSDGSQRAKPEAQTAALCKEVTANPELLDDVLMKLKYQKAKLESEVTEVMSKLKEYEVME